VTNPTAFEVALSRSFGLEVDGVYVYRADELPDEGEEIVVTNTATGEDVHATVKHIAPKARFPIYATES
jgi:hypothetical protein